MEKPPDPLGQLDNMIAELSRDLQRQKEVEQGAFRLAEMERQKRRSLEMRMHHFLEARRLLMHAMDRDSGGREDVQQMAIDWSPTTHLANVASDRSGLPFKDLVLLALGKLTEGGDSVTASEVARELAKLDRVQHLEPKVLYAQTYTALRRHVLAHKVVMKRGPKGTVFMPRKEGDAKS